MLRDAFRATKKERKAQLAKDKLITDKCGLELDLVLEEDEDEQMIAVGGRGKQKKARGKMATMGKDWVLQKKEHQRAQGKEVQEQMQKVQLRPRHEAAV